MVSSEITSGRTARAADLGSLLVLAVAAHALGAGLGDTGLCSAN